MDHGPPAIFYVVGTFIGVVGASIFAIVISAFCRALCCPPRPKGMNGTGHVVAVPITVHSRSSPGVFGGQSSISKSNHHFHNSSAGHHIISMDTSGGYPGWNTDIISSSNNCDSGWNGDSGGFSGGDSGGCSGGDSGGCSGGDSGGCSGGDSGGGSTSCD